MKKKLLACLMVVAMIFGALALSSCSIGEVVDKIDSVKNGLESIGENLPWKDSDCKESLGNSEKEPSESSGTTHSHYFERVPSERCLKSSASCTKKAEYYYSCSCGELDSKTFEYGDYEHKEVIDKAIDPTCTETGLTEGKHCSECSKILTAQTELPALRHNIVNHDGKPATCTEKGYEPYETCTRCDYTTYREIPLAEHDLDNGFCKNCGKEITPHTHIEVIDKGTPATCLNQGLTDGKHCSICNKVLESQTVIPALGHDLTSHSGKAATCIEKGWNAYNTCSRCSYTTYREIPALGHDIVSHIGKAATCTDVGYKNYETCSRCTYTTYEELPALGHNLTYHNGKAATCLESGYDAYEECSRCDYTTYRKINALGHDYVSHSGKEATCTEAGYKDYETCSRCSYTTYEEIPALGHNYVNGKCMRCGAGDEATYSRDGNYVYFGSYPQTKVSNETLINTLNTKTGKLPTKENNYLWTSYKYYLNYSTNDYMWYIDEDLNGFKYRGVYFTSYRPNYCTTTSSTSYFQEDNGYYLNTVYWFRYEPIKWRLLTELTGKAFLMCDIAIDSQQYYHTGDLITIDEKTVYSNNYKESEIRHWLNNTFYNTAFSDLQKTIIRTTNVNNNARSTNPYCSSTYWNEGKNDFTCEDTNDKVFLLSEYEVTNPAYGFSSNMYGDSSRQLNSSDYAKSQGNSQYNNDFYNGKCRWLLRSPDFQHVNCLHNIIYDGTPSIKNGINDFTGYGIVPALWITLNNNGEHMHEITYHEGKAVTCTEVGYAAYEYCVNCDYSTYEEIPALGHNFVNGTCTRCGESDGYTYTREGNYIYFGSYPQTKVTDQSLVSSLNYLAGTLPTSSNSYSWTSYGYYISGSIQDFMWYIDKTYNNSKYRGIYFTSYRRLSCTTNETNNWQDNNGYYTSNVYWFKYEPIKWRILTEYTGKAFLMCDMAIDTQQYYHTSRDATRTINGKTVNENNYAESDIRKWLNETFYNTAFTPFKKSLIQTTVVDNSARSTNPYNNATKWNSGKNSYACENTSDKVFLLSEYEVTNTAYGFNGKPLTQDTARRLKSSDYAKSQGCGQGDRNYEGNCCWWLRSPYCSESYSTRIVLTDGYCHNRYFTNSSYMGVVPALWIAL